MKPWILVRFFSINAYLFIGSLIVEGHPISIRQSTKNAQYVVNLVGYIVSICVGSALFVKTHITSPGFVEKRGQDIELQQQEMDPHRFCTKCQHIRPPRSKHCNDCQHCIVKFGKLLIKY
jgi:hypothetical protein